MSPASAPNTQDRKLTLKAIFPRGRKVDNFPNTMKRGYAGGCAVPRKKEAEVKRPLSPTYTIGDTV